jgi:hypothetical protein
MSFTLPDPQLATLPDVIPVVFERLTKRSGRPPARRRRERESRTRVCGAFKYRAMMSAAHAVATVRAPCMARSRQLIWRIRFDYCNKDAFAADSAAPRDQRVCLLYFRAFLNAAGVSAQPSPRAASSSGLLTMTAGAVRWYLHDGYFSLSISGEYCGRAARRLAIARSCGDFPTQCAAAWLALGQDFPQCGQGRGLQGRPPRKHFRADAIRLASRVVS